MLTDSDIGRIAAAVVIKMNRREFSPESIRLAAQLRERALKNLGRTNGADGYISSITGKRLGHE